MIGGETAQASGSIRILIVEDEYLIALDEQNRLASMGYSEISLANSGELATDRVARECPDLVLMNVNLAGEMNGVEAAERIQSQCDASIIFVSGYGAERVGVKDTTRFLRKPFTDAAFRKVIRHALT